MLNLIKKQNLTASKKISKVVIPLTVTHMTDRQSMNVCKIGRYHMIRIRIEDVICMCGPVGLMMTKFKGRPFQLQ